jgi:eukaryotic-like serine/threonine-protein kinase
MTLPDPTTPSLANDTVVDTRRPVTRCPECNQHFGADARFCPFDGSELAHELADGAGDTLLGAIVDDRYEVCAVLGEGGMGTVYKVRHTKLDRTFAMKVLRRDLARDKDLAARFTQEARATASIKHPNIVQITDYGTLADDVPYFVMELLLGQPLSTAMKTHEVLPLAVAVNLILKIAGALGAAHDAGVVHRDLKPENVFLVGRGSAGGLPEDVRILDFGAAKVMGASRITKTGIVFGTPHFMSPEQAAGKVVDHRADIYALGVIMYVLFTGRVPFEADTYMGVLTQHMFVKPVPPSSVSPHASGLGALEELTLKALEKEPEARFRSMGDLAAEVQRVVRFGPSGEPIVEPARPRRSDGPVAMPWPMAESEGDPLAIPRSGVPLWVFAAAGAIVIGAGAATAFVTLRTPAPPPPSASPTLPPPTPTPPPPVPSPPPVAVAPASPSPPAAASAPDPHPAADATPPRRRPSPKPAAAPKSGVDSDFVDPWKKDRP